MSKRNHISGQAFNFGDLNCEKTLTQDTNGFHFVNAILISQVVEPQRKHFLGNKTPQDMTSV